MNGIDITIHTVSGKAYPLQITRDDAIGLITSKGPAIPETRQECTYYRTALILPKCSEISAIRPDGDGIFTMNPNDAMDLGLSPVRFGLTSESCEALNAAIDSLMG